MRPPKLLHALTRFGCMWWRYVTLCIFKFYVSMVCLCIVVITLLTNNYSYACVVVG